MRLTIFVLLVFVFVSAFVFVAPAAADSPQADLQPWMFAAASQCRGGCTPAEVQRAFTNFQNARAAATANYDWKGDYDQAVTDFLHQSGWVTAGITDGQHTYTVKIALPFGFAEYVDILPVQFKAFVK